jgi:hypothetical protein
MSDLRKKMLEQGREIVRLQDLNAELEKLCRDAINELQASNLAIQNLITDLAELNLEQIQKLVNS